MDIVGGETNIDNFWIPRYSKGVYVWSPPPAGASIAATERLDLYGEVSFATGIDDADNGYGTKVGAKFNF